MTCQHAQSNIMVSLLSSQRAQSNIMVSLLSTVDSLFEIVPNQNCFPPGTDTTGCVIYEREESRLDEGEQLVPEGRRTKRTSCTLENVYRKCLMIHHFRIVLYNMFYEK